MKKNWRIPSSNARSASRNNFFQLKRLIMQEHFLQETKRRKGERKMRQDSLNQLVGKTIERIKYNEDEEKLQITAGGIKVAISYVPGHWDENCPAFHEGGLYVEVSNERTTKLKAKPVKKEKPRKLRDSCFKVKEL